jgi:glyoxylase-like metal-dependent hydrolase (beta-lactamase superfamily II)
MSGADGTKYLFTGDTLLTAGDGTWTTFLVPHRSVAAQLTASLQLLKAERPDVVVCSAFHGESAIETVDGRRWSEIVDQALASVSGQIGTRAT